MKWNEKKYQAKFFEIVPCSLFQLHAGSMWKTYALHEKLNEKYFNTVWPILMYRSHTTYLYTQNKDNISILKYKLWEKLRVRISGKRMRMVGRGLSLFTFHFYCLNDLKITMLYLVRNFLLFSLLLIYF